MRVDDVINGLLFLVSLVTVQNTPFLTEYNENCFVYAYWPAISVMIDVLAFSAFLSNRAVCAIINLLSFTFWLILKNVFAALCLLLLYNKHSHLVVIRKVVQRETSCDTIYIDNAFLRQSIA